MAGPIIRGPLYVTTPTKRWGLQPDLPKNLAVALGVLAALHPLVEPTFYKRPAAPIDIAPNIAALATPAAPQPVPPSLDVPIYRRPPPQIDVISNIAVQFPAVGEAHPLPPFLFVSTNFRQWAAPDVLPNIAVQVQPLIGLVTHSPEPTYFKRPAPQIDLTFNVALALQPAQTSITSADSLPGKIWPQIEVFPNVAVNVPVVFYKPPPPIEPPPPRRYFTQIDFFPNVSLQGVEPPRLFPALEWVLPTRKWPTPDVLPNPALFNFPPLLFEQPYPVITKRLWAPFDIYPNVASLAPVEKVPLIEPIDPWTNKRYPPQVEVFQNQAIYVPAAPPLPPSGLIEPVLFKGNWQRSSQPDFYQNTALLVSTIPVLQPTPIFIWLNGPPVSPHDGLQYLYWRPTAGEIFLIAAAGMRTITQITVGASPFIYTAQQNQLVLIGGGQLINVVYDGIYPPSAPPGFVTPPTPGTGFVLNYDSGNDLAIPVNRGAILTITYTQIPSMWWVK